MKHSAPTGRHNSAQGANPVYRIIIQVGSINSFLAILNMKKSSMKGHPVSVPIGEAGDEESASGTFDRPKAGDEEVLWLSIAFRRATSRATLSGEQAKSSGLR